ncbi:MAG: hypothetical protein ACON4U_17175 [Myxococcota bacterium]
MSILLRSVPISLSWNNNQFSLASNSQYLICQDNQTHFIRSEQRIQEYIQGIGAIYSIADGVQSLPRPKASAAIAIRAIREFYQGATLSSPVIQLTRFVDQSHYKLKHKAEKDNIAPLGASIVSAWVLDERLHFVNIGNTRLYEYTDKKLIQHSVDQSIEHFNQRSTDSGARLGQAFLFGRYDHNEQLHIELGENVKSIKVHKGQRFLLCSASFPMLLGQKLNAFLDLPIEQLNAQCKATIQKVSFQSDVSAIVLDIN